jgi:DNA-directed RNA polymerase subunit omega
LQSGSHALVSSQSTKPCRIAQDEISAGKISYVKTDVPVLKPIIEDRAIPILAS